MIDEGYIKYQIDWKDGPAPTHDLTELIAARNALHCLGWIGEYAELGIGFGNVSQKASSSNHFYVSGTQTGHIPELDPGHFSTVTSVDIPANQLSCIGPLKASSESLTHAAIYACDPAIRSVLHIHHAQLWAFMCNNYPTTGKDIPYGTPDMANEVFRLYQESKLPTVKLFAMAGHDEGIMAFGPNPMVVFQSLVACFKEYDSDFVLLELDF